MFGQPGSQIGGFPKKRLIWVGVLALAVGLSVDMGLYFWNKNQAMDSAHAAAAACERGKLEECATLYTKALETYEFDPKGTAVILVNRGIAYRDSGKLDFAAKDFEKAIELAPHSSDAFVQRAWLFFKKKEFVQAIDDCSRAVDLNPESTLAFYVRGTARVQLGAIEPALVDLNRAIQIDPSDAKPYFSRGVAHIGMKDYDRAVSDLERAVELDPDWEGPRKMLQKIKAERASSPPS